MFPKIYYVFSFSWSKENSVFVGSLGALICSAGLEVVEDEIVSFFAIFLYLSDALLYVYLR